MKVFENYSLKKFNTFGIDVKSKWLIVFDSVYELITILEKKDIQHDSKYILGGGSNILFTKDYTGLMLKSGIRGIDMLEQDDNHAYVKVGGGEVWHDFVMNCVKQNFGGVENMSLIPGTVGAAPIQNIGAYGAELKDTFHELEVLHLDTLKQQIFSKEECKFGYRDSVFKQQYKGKVIILSVTFKLNKNPVPNTSYGDINKELETQNVSHPSIKDVSEAVCNIRSRKLPDYNALGNAGSFFKNPIINENSFLLLKEQYPGIIGYKSGERLMKIAAGWLIEQCGWKGKTIGNAGVHKNQALVLINYGGATGKEIINLASKIQDSVMNSFGITLEPEINIL